MPLALTPQRTHYVPSTRQSLHDLLLYTYRHFSQLHIYVARSPVYLVPSAGIGTV